MFEPIAYFGIGFIVAALLGMPFMPLVHKRAVRLMTRRLGTATQRSIAEIRAEKDKLRAEFLTVTRQHEMRAEHMKTQATTQLAELGRMADTINRLRKEHSQKMVAIFTLESSCKNLQDQLRGAAEGLERTSSLLSKAERMLTDKKTDIAQRVAELGECSILVDSQRVELASLRTQVEAMQCSIADYKRVLNVAKEHLVRERGATVAVMKETDEARGKIEELVARTGELERRLFMQTKEAEILSGRVPDLEIQLSKQDQLLAKLESEINRLRGDLQAMRKTESDLRSAIDECSRLRHEIATIKQEAVPVRAAMDVESSLLRERIIDLVAEVTGFIAVLEGRGSPIESLLVVEGPPLGNRMSGIDRKGVDPTLDPEQPRKSTIGDRIRALQSAASRMASS